MALAYDQDEPFIMAVYVGFILLAVISAAVLLLTTVGQVPQQSNASSLALEAPPAPQLPVNGSVVDLTADDKDRDISIDPLDPLPANGTVTIPTAGATDTDINEFPPIGVTVLIQNDSITVTRNQVSIEDPTFNRAATITDESSNDED